MDALNGNVTVSQERLSGGGLGRFRITLTGLPVSQDIMRKIWRKYLQRHRRYYENTLGIRAGQKTSTGQTLGRTGHNDDTVIEENRVTFQFPIHPRLGDKKRRNKTARENNWKLPATKIQRGKRAGQPWEPPKYNEVAEYIEEMKGQPVMFHDGQEIRQIVLDELRRAR